MISCQANCCFDIGFVNVVVVFISGWDHFLETLLGQNELCFHFIYFYVMFHW